MPNFSGRYRSSGDASMRHRNTYVAILNVTTGVKTPYYVEEVSGDRQNPSLVLSNRTEGSRSAHIGDSDLIMERPTLGMVNYRCDRTRKLFAVWHESNAGRQVKRSLDFSLIEPKIVGRQSLERDTFCRPESNSSNRELAVYAFFNKEYPRYSQCLEGVSSGANYSLAFSDRFALCVHILAGVVLYYKEQIVGYLGDTHPILLSQFEYLQEQLEEAANGYV